MSRGFQRTSASGFRAKESYRLPLAGEVVAQLRAQMNSYRSTLDMLKQKWGDQPAYRPVAKMLKDLKKAVEQREYFINEAEALIRDGLAGKLDKMLPKLKKEADEAYGAKLLAYYELKSRGIKIGPSRDELTPQKMFEMVDGDAGRETVMHFDKDGAFMLGVTGKKGEISCRAPQEASMGELGYTNPGGSDFHNHPRNDGRSFGYPPSPTDIAGAVLSGVKERIIGSHEGTYIIRVPDAARAKFDRNVNRKFLTQDAKSISSEWDMAFSRAIKKVEKEVADEKGFSWPIINNVFNFPDTGERVMKATLPVLKEVAQKNGLEFEFIPNKGFEHLST